MTTGPAGAAEPAVPVQPEQARWDPPAAPRWDAPLNVVHPETVIAGQEPPPAADVAPPPAGEPANPWAAGWDNTAIAGPSHANEPASPWSAGWDNTATAGPGHANEPASPWSAGWDNTVTAGPGHANAYAPPPYAPPAYAPPAAPGPGYVPPPSPGPGYVPPPPGGQGQRPGRRMTGIFVVIGVVVVLAAGGGAYALTRSQHPTAQPRSQPTRSATTSSPTAAQTTASDTSSPTVSPSPSPTPSPTRTGTVQVAPGVSGDPAEPRVLAYVNRYFAAINAHNYNAYYNLLDAQMQAGESRASFDSGYATTKDSDEVLTGIDDTGGGDVTANLSFTSRQSPADSIDGSACNTWQISLYLVPQGSGYAQAAPPPGYQSTHGDC